MKINKDYWLIFSLSLILIILYFIKGMTVFLILAILFTIASVFSKKLCQKISQLIFLIIHWVSLITTWIVLGISYIFLLTPIARLQCFFLQNPIRMKTTRKPSYYTERNHIYRHNDFENPW